MAYYAIGDIHGQYDLFMNVYNEILDDINTSDEENYIIFLGDFIDRGPENKKVVDKIRSLKDTDDLKHICLMGNHEELFILARERDIHATQIWLEQGGYATMRNYSTDIRDVQHGSMDDVYNWFKENCKDYHETPDYVFCHGGLYARIPLRSVESRVFRWMRTRVKDGRYHSYDRIVVHGHTPTESYKPEYGNNEICVDLGFGQVAAVKLPLKYSGEDFKFYVSG